ncbi:MAG TPA: hypothetical protein VEF03_07200 [Candidatus Binataceae bacterium]|nr:hypothetical protein [Candidatus Binataceae bacterium]
MRKTQNSCALPRRARATWTIWVTGAALMAVLFGACSTSTPPETAAQKQVLATFDLNKCEVVGVNLYKCPAIDKPICSIDYNGPLECVRIGKKGSVFIANPSMD